MLKFTQNNFLLPPVNCTIICNYDIPLSNSNIKFISSSRRASYVHDSILAEMGVNGFSDTSLNFWNTFVEEVVYSSAYFGNASRT